MTRFEQILVAVNAALLGLLTLVVSTVVVKEQIIISDMHETLQKLDARMDKIEAFHNKGEPHP